MEIENKIYSAVESKLTVLNISPQIKIMKLREKGGDPNGRNGKEKLPEPLTDSQGALKELITMAEERKGVSLTRFFGLVNAFATEKRRHQEGLSQMEEIIRKSYDQFSSDQRTEFFSMLYDAFAERYDEHMGEETGHYEAIRNVLGYACAHVRPPLLDITAGTGEALKYVIEYIEAARIIKGLVGREADPILSRFPVHPDTENGLGDSFCANEISPKMLEKARKKLDRHNGVAFTQHSAYDLPDELKGQFNTVLCSQTFHLISNEDKLRLVQSIREALTEDGIAVVIEEDPFKISSTPQIEPVSLFIRSVAEPIKRVDALIGMFEVNGFAKMEERAVHHIDQEHVMRLHMFMKSVVRISTGCSHGGAYSSPVLDV